MTATLIPLDQPRWLAGLIRSFAPARVQPLSPAQLRRVGDEIDLRDAIAADGDPAHADETIA